MKEEILSEIRKRGLLLEKEIYDLVDNINDTRLALDFLKDMEEKSGQKIITKSILTKNIGTVRQFVGRLGGEEKVVVQSVFVKLGVSLEIKKRVDGEESELEEVRGGVVRRGIIEEKKNFEVTNYNLNTDRKLEVGDFVSNFRSRYSEIQRILMNRQELGNLISINRISDDRKNVSIIGIVSEKRITKNKNLILKFEDLTGEINTLVKFDREEVFKKAEELQLDDVVGIVASGNRDMLFVHDIFFPDAHMNERVSFDEDVYIAFVSDVHCGSVYHLGKRFERMLDWLESDDEVAKKVRYMFFVGDNVDGVGIFPGQERVLKLKSMENQYKLLEGYLKRIPKHINIFMCPGQHDASRVAEPQPAINKKYAPGLYEIENLELVTNPSLVKIREGIKEFKVLMYHGASIHGFINEIPELREIKAHTCPAKAVKHMLKRRHLAPTHSSVTYIPGKNKDPLVITDVPDLVCMGEVHRLDVDSYNGVLIITCGCWQEQTDFEEKIGNVPDPGKMPVLSLKTRELKIYDFNEGEK